MPVSALPVCPLPERGVIEVSGPESRAFLQGLISNNIDFVTATQAIYAALLTPQGKYLFDFFIARRGEVFLIDCEAARRADLVKRLNFYKLRAKAAIRDASGDFSVAVLSGDTRLEALNLPVRPGAATAFDGGVVYRDPRLTEMGARLILPPAALAGLNLSGQACAQDYHRRRIELGLAEGARDIAVDKYFLLEANFEELNGVDFKKGCYVGQELVSRMKHRGVVRKRILPVRIKGPCPAPGAPVLAAGREVGVLHSVSGDRALAFLRLASVAPGAPALSCGEAQLNLALPAWLTVTFPETADEQD